MPCGVEIIGGGPQGVLSILGFAVDGNEQATKSCAVGDQQGQVLPICKSSERRLSRAGHEARPAGRSCPSQTGGAESTEKRGRRCGGVEV